MSSIDSRQSPRSSVVLAVLLVVAGLLYATPATAVEIPSAPSTAYQQTTGREAGLNIGDYYTNVAGDDTDHFIDVEVGCGWPAATPVTVALFDPELNDGHGTATPYAVDEIRDDAGNDSTNEADAEDTEFRLLDPLGGVIRDWTRFTPNGGSDGLWVELVTFTPANRPAGAQCGTFQLNSRVVDDATITANDDNSWRLRVQSDPDCTDSETVPGSCSGIGAALSALIVDGDDSSNLDGLAGTGDEVAIGYTRASQQHAGAGTTCQDYYFFDAGTIGPTFSVRNFDMDVSGSITYFPPSGGSIAGTRSANQSWASDTLSSDIGWWRTDVCINATNQYIFDGIAGRTVYFELPPSGPRLSLTKTDGVASAAPGGSLTYDIDFSNDSIHLGGGAPAYNVVITDALDSGTAFASCQVVAPLTGSCVEAPAGTVTFSIDQAINPSGAAAPTGGSVELVVTVDTDFAGTLVNTATVTYTDAFTTEMPPATDTDGDTVVPLTIGDLVFEDLNGNGIQDGGEPGIDGVTVNLRPAGGGPVILSDVSSGGGFYILSGAAPSTYDVEFVKPAGFSITAQDLGGDDTADSDPNPTTGVVAVDVSGGASTPTVDAGLYVPVEIGDFVFEDLNGNGVQDGGEPGIDGVTVSLVGAGPDCIFGNGDDTSASTLTAGGGLYSFTNQPPGDYQIDVTAPVGMTFSAPDQGGDDTGDSDVDGSGNAGFSVTSGTDDTSIDAGAYVPAPAIHIETSTNGSDADTPTGPYFPVGAVVTWTYVVTNPGNVPLSGVWVVDDQGVAVTFVGGDVNFNGQLDQTETWTYDALGIAGVGQYANVATATGTPPFALPDASDDDPSHYFGEDAGLLVIKSTDGADADSAPGPYLPIGATVTWDYVVTNLGNVELSGVTLSDDSGTPAPGDDFAPAYIGGDTDADTRLDPAETWTYQATGIAGAGQYGNVATVGAISPSGATPGDIDASHYYGADGSIGDLVWNDLNGDGVQDPGEAAMSGITVSLLGAGPNGTFGDGDDVAYLDQMTGPGGGFDFAQLPPGVYEVELDVTSVPAGFVPTTPTTMVVTLGIDENFDGADFGLWEPASITGIVWNDGNGDGQLDGAEPGIAGVTVELFASGDLATPLQSTVTGAAGDYSFNDLAPGDYTVKFVPPVGYIISPQDAAPDTEDSDADPVTGFSHDLTLAPGQETSTIFAGMSIPSASLGDRVWYDVNGDGVQDSDEPGVGGVVVQLLDGTGAVIATTVTPAPSFASDPSAGTYAFDNLPPGTYTVVVDPVSLPPGMTVSTFDPDGSSDGKAGVTLTRGENRVDLDFGFVGVGVIGDTVWHDLNGTGVQDFGDDGVIEAGIEGVTVTVIWAGPDNVFGTPDDYHYEVQATDVKGNYLYSRLPFGEFQVEVGNVDALVLQVANVQFVTLNAADGAVAGAVLTVDFPFRVLATSESLPHTGAETDRIAGLGLVLLLGGAFLLLITRKRRENA